MTSVWSRLIEDPSGVVRRSWFKLVSGPARYGLGDGYESERYWSDRFAKYGQSLKGCGHEGLSESENAELYEQGRAALLETCRRERIDLAARRTLEVGCGSGYWARVLHRLGARNYTGLDITDTLFPVLTKEFPEFSFVKADICRNPVGGPYDLVIMIDVLEHIVEEDKLASALGNIRDATAPGGVFLVALPFRQRPGRRFFYLRFWRKEDIVANFPGWGISPELSFRGGSIFALERPAHQKEIPEECGQEVTSGDA